MKKLKGFTLLELIIVMAIFSIIMYSAVQLLDPVSKFFVRSSNFENTNACTDNMRRCIEGNLKYADRVRVYSGFAPYDGSPSTPSSNMISNVQSFYMEFFKNRKFIDSSGQINVLVFDNTSQTIVDTSEGEAYIYDKSTNTPLTTLSEYTGNAYNEGKIILYQFPFNNYNNDDETTLQANMAPVKEWCVNQKLYGNFDYRFALNAVSNEIVSSNENPFIVTSSGQVTEPIATRISTDIGGQEHVIAYDFASENAIFDPRDFNISINISEIKRVHKTDGSVRLIRETPTTSIVASFAMKNVLNAADGYRTAALDYIPILASGDEHGTHRYEIDKVRSPVARYTNLNKNETGTDLFDGFYFIFTLPEEMHDVAEDTGIGGNWDPNFLDLQEAVASSTPT